ncbi:MAG: sulfatase-like hydrolase/transferase [Planctomycetota bacterium]|nr:sulfatase-like hydrolase/transferase [Planctomycetota bacterium]
MTHFIIALTVLLVSPLALVAAEPPNFTFDAPSGPQFSDAEMQTQRDKGTAVVPLVRKAFESGADSVTIPPGDYRFGKEQWGRDGVIYPLEFSDLLRDDAHPFAIDAAGATFWFDLPDDQAPSCHFCIGFKDCRNILFKGATIDRATRGHVEGRITQFDFANSRIELQLSPGITVPATFNDKLEQRVIPFTAAGTFCAPLYAMQAGGVHLKYQRISQATTEGRCWVTMGDTKLLDTIRDTGLLRVGDGLSCIYTVTSSLELVRCAKLTMDGIRVYAAKAWGAEYGGYGAHVWRNCYFGPRPGTSQWQGGEGFMFNATRHGTMLDGVVIRHTTDDIANFHGYWGHIESLAGDRVTFVRSGEFDRTVMRDAAPGDRLLFRDRNTGQPLGEACVAGTEGRVVIADRPVAAFTNAIVEWPDHACADWRVSRCDFQDNYQRLLIQSGPGTVSNCLFARQGCGIEINSDFPYVEGGVARDITITGNTFVDVNPQPGGAAVSMHTHTYNGGAPPFSNIVITGNTFIRPGSVAIRLDSFHGGIIAGNRFEQTVVPPVELKRCSGICEEDNRPNILWLVAEDMSPHFGCYGDQTIQTPNVDRLAARGVLFERAFVTAPICSPSRSALITGMYQTSIGAQNHRSGRGKEKTYLPSGVEPVPHLFQQAGYYTCNGGYHPARRKGKTDYNFQSDARVYDGTDWSGRRTGQPFFAQIQLLGGKTRDLPDELAKARQQLGSSTATNNLSLPPYYPRTPAMLADWVATLDAVRITDKYVGEIVERLRTEGILEQTVVFFISDHGVSHARGKQFLYDEGTHIPFVVSGPGLAQGQRRTDLIEHIDMAATSLALANIPVPAQMQARNVLATDYKPRDAVFAARDRADETVDRIRSVRTGQWKYIRNFLSLRPYLQPNAYKDHKPCLIALREAEAAGQLDATQRLILAPTRPPEELYDVQADPWEIHNLAADPAQATTLKDLRARLDLWMEQTGDQGRTPASESLYDSDMAAYLGSKGDAEIEKNIKLMKQWAREGK